jgi:hypothetical protein
MLVVVGLNYFNIIKVKNKNMNLSIKEINELIYSLGITYHNGNFVNKDLNESLLEKLYSELNSKIAEEAIDEEVDEPEYDSAGFSIEDRYPHFVSNEEADEDYRSTLEQDSDRYETSVIDDYRIHLRKLKTRGYASQALLDYVDRVGAVTHKELERYYKQITGSNSFSHVLANLRIPYKNRKTQRYLVKEGKRYSDAKYVVKLANPSNWVISDY